MTGQAFSQMCVGAVVVQRGKSSFRAAAQLVKSSMRLPFSHLSLAQSVIPWGEHDVKLWAAACVAAEAVGSSMSRGEPIPSEHK